MEFLKRSLLYVYTAFGMASATAPQRVNKGFQAFFRAFLRYGDLVDQPHSSEDKLADCCDLLVVFGKIPIVSIETDLCAGLWHIRQLVYDRKSAVGACERRDQAPRRNTVGVAYCSFGLAVLIENLPGN